MKKSKRIIKLTENDVEILVKRILNEEGGVEWMMDTYNMDEHSEEEMNTVWDKLNRMNSDIVFEMMEKTFNEKSMSVESFVDYLQTWMGYDYDYLVSVLKQIQNEGI